jgi:hypothetical protein
MGAGMKSATDSNLISRGWQALDRSAVLRVFLVTGAMRDPMSAERVPYEVTEAPEPQRITRAASKGWTSLATGSAYPPPPRHILPNLLTAAFSTIMAP